MLANALPFFLLFSRGAAFSPPPKQVAFVACSFLSIFCVMGFGHFLLCPSVVSFPRPHPVPDFSSVKSIFSPLIYVMVFPPPRLFLFLYCPPSQKYGPSTLDFFFSDTLPPPSVPIPRIVFFCCVFVSLEFRTAFPCQRVPDPFLYLFITFVSVCPLRAQNSVPMSCPALTLSFDLVSLVFSPWDFTF